MMFVQNIEIFGRNSAFETAAFQTSVSPISYLVSVYIRFYVVVIYINHFKRGYHTAAVIVSKSLTIIGIMTVFEMNGIRMNCPYLL